MLTSSRNAILRQKFKPADADFYIKIEPCGINVAVKTWNIIEIILDFNLTKETSIENQVSTYDILHTQYEKLAFQRKKLLNCRVKTADSVACGSFLKEFGNFL